MIDWNTRGYMDGYGVRPFAALEAYRAAGALAVERYAYGYEEGERDRKKNPKLAEERRTIIRKDAP